MLKHEAVTCDYVIDELRRNIAKKFPDRMNYLNFYLLELSLNIETHKVSYDIDNESLNIRDPYDKPILKAALESKCDLLITGDKDFLESNIKNPICLKSKEFLDKY